MHKGHRLIAAFLALALSVPTSFAMTFPDTTGTRYSEAYAYLSERSIVNGYSDGTGRPYDLINRAEALKVVLGSNDTHTVKLEWFTKHLPPMPLFVDVDQKAWYAAYLETGFQEGIVTGYGDRTFRPGNPLLVEEAIVLLLRAHGEAQTPQPFQTNAALENQDGQWFTNYINVALTKNLVSKREVLRLGQRITRGQFFDMVYRMHVVKAEKLTAFNRPEPEAPVVQAPRVQPVVYRPTQVSPVARPTTNVPTRPTALPVGVAAAGELQYASDRYFSVTIPKLGIKDLVITHPVDPFTSNGILGPLKNGVGHLFSYPGAGGKILIYGHSSGYPWDVSQFTKIFRKVNQLNKGDMVYVTYNGNMYVYQVSYENAVPASDTSAYSGPGEELILYTCWPPDSISQRYLVHALPVKTVALR